MPKGTLHAHRNMGNGMGRVLLSQTPGGLYELFFQKAGRTSDGENDEGPALEERPNLANIVAIAAEHGIEIPPPFAEESQPRNTIKL